MTFANTLRLNTYMHNKSQTENLSLFGLSSSKDSDQQKITKIFHLPEEDIGADGRLFQYFYIALPLYQRLREFCWQHKTLDETQKHNFFQKNSFYWNNVASQGSVNYRLARYQTADSNFEELLQEPVYSMQILHMIGRVYAKLGKLDKAIHLYHQILGAQQINHNDDADVIPYLELEIIDLNDLSSLYIEQGNYDEAIKYYTQSLDRQHAINQVSHQNKVASLNGLGNAYNATGHHDKAIQYHSQSLEILHKIYDGNIHSDIAVSFNGLGNAYNSRGDRDVAMNYYTRALKMLQVIYNGELHLDIANSLDNFGVIYRDMGDYDKAIEYHTRSLDMREKICNGASHFIATSLSNLGIVYQSKCDYENAIHYHTLSFKMQTSICNGRGMVTAAYHLGNAYHYVKNYDKAIYYHTLSLTILELTYKGALYHDTIASLDALGHVYQSQKNYDAAIEHYTRSLEIRKSIGEPEVQLSLVDVFNNLGNAYQKKGNHTEAIKYHLQSLQIQKTIYKDKVSPDTAACLYNLGSIYASQGHYDESAKCYIQALQIISIFPNHSFKEIIQNGLVKLAKHYALDDKVMNELLGKDALSIVASDCKIGIDHSSKYPLETLSMLLSEVTKHDEQVNTNVTVKHTGVNLSGLE